jgi:acyl-CoA synthetase (AMP-forming)/AMP-acid ligase II
VQEEELSYQSIAATSTGNSSLLSSSSSSSSSTMRIVGCGYPSHGEDVHAVIVSTAAAAAAAVSGAGAGAGEDEERSSVATLLPDLEVGEIWIDSPSKARGYWQNPELSQHDFHATLPTAAVGESEGRSYLRTGDMGFLSKGELFICGRSKDMIILGGANHYPQDIERSIEQGLGEYLRNGCSAAIAVNASQMHKLNTNEAGEVVVFLAEVRHGLTHSLTHSVWS